MGLKRDGENTGRSLTMTGRHVDASPIGFKNFYHEPESPSRAFLLEFMSVWYLLKLCYSFFLTIYLDLPVLIFPAWFIRWRILLPQLKVAKGTCDGVCLAINYGWAINLDGGFTHCGRDFGSMFNVYPDISLAIYYAKKWHINNARRILVINTSCCQANGVVRSHYQDEGVFVLDIYDPSIKPLDKGALPAINMEATVGSFDNEESYISKCRLKVTQAISTYGMVQLIIF